MKISRVITIAFAFVMLFAMQTVANAASGISDAEQALLDRLEGGIEAGDVIIPVSSSDLSQLEAYFADNDVSDDQIAEIEDYIDEAAVLVEEEGVTSLSDLSTDAKTEIIGLADSAAGVVGASLSYDAESGDVVVLDGDGNTIFESAVAADDTLDEVEAEEESDSVVTQTGGVGLETTAGVLALAIIALASCAIVARRRAAQA